MEDNSQFGISQPWCAFNDHNIPSVDLRSIPERWLERRKLSLYRSPRVPDPELPENPFPPVRNLAAQADSAEKEQEAVHCSLQRWNLSFRPWASLGLWVH